MCALKYKQLFNVATAVGEAVKNVGYFPLDTELL